MITPMWPGLPELPLIITGLLNDPIVLPESVLQGHRPTRHALSLVVWLISKPGPNMQKYLQLRQTLCFNQSHQKPSHNTNITGSNFILVAHLGLDVVPLSR